MAHGHHPPVSVPASVPAFRCPVCRGELQRQAQSNDCATCRRSFPILDSIPMLVADFAATDHDETDHAHGTGDSRRSGPRKAAQAAHFDDMQAAEFEISRPHGTPRLYQSFLAEKLERATEPFLGELRGCSALVVCGGSGMEAEFLARAGAVVVSSDLSRGAAARAKVRAQRYGLDITPVIADVENLPFADASFDLVLVHDGLHHLDRPELGLGEMARVSRRWISVTEPAQAAVTALAVRLGMAQETEDSGNRVERLTQERVIRALRTAGFRQVVSQRYAMYYRHQPGWLFRAMSAKGIFPIVVGTWRIANSLVGRVGNKLVVVAKAET